LRDIYEFTIGLDSLALPAFKRKPKFLMKRNGARMVREGIEFNAKTQARSTLSLLRG
jgi:hypothetical protein